jgi:drug/metabolite transporter (DMT)-like permease
MSKPENRGISLQAVLACLLWSTAFMFVKSGLDYMPPLSLAGSRFLLAGLIQLPLCRSPGQVFGLFRTDFKTVLKVSLFHTIYLYGTFFMALTLVRGAQAAIVVGCGPLVSALTAHVMMPNDRLAPRMFRGILCGISGVALVSLSTRPWTAVGLRELAGLLLLLSGSVVSAVGNVTVARKKGALPPVALNSAQMLLGGAVLLAMALPLEGLPDFQQPPRFYGTLGWLAFVSAAGFAIWFHLLARVKVSRLNVWKFLIPLSGATLSWTFIPGESPDAGSLAGMLLIAAGIFTALRRPKKADFAIDGRI